MKLSDQTLEHWIKEAEQILHFAFPKDFRAIVHATRIASAVEDRLKPIAFLHDVVEDTNVTLDDLQKLGFPSYIIEAVKLLTHIKGVPNIEYWAGIKQNSDALSVKKEDINDNLNDKPSEHAKQKYALALKFFSEP